MQVGLGLLCGQPEAGWCWLSAAGYLDQEVFE
jgi:hypothetical protein